MGDRSANWKILEAMMIELKKKSVSIPQNIIEDLRISKSMIILSYVENSRGEALQEIEGYLSNVEAYLVDEGQKTFGKDWVNSWLQRLEDACNQVNEEPLVEDRFITGIPRNQKWVRIEPLQNLSSIRIEEMAKKEHLQVNPQKDGHLLISGQPKNIKVFLRKMTNEIAKQ